MELGSPLLGERARHVLGFDGQEAYEAVLPAQEQFIPAVAV